MENYILAKANIFKTRWENRISLILNADNELILTGYRQNSKANVILLVEKRNWIEEVLLVGENIVIKEYGKLYEIYAKQKI